MKVFVDASAIVAIIANEPDRDDLVQRMKLHKDRQISPLVVYEAVTALSRIKKQSNSEALLLIEKFLKIYAFKSIPIDMNIAKSALETQSVFGRGNHPAKLNMGDCFSYACASKHKLSLLFKGEDFNKTTGIKLA